MKGIIKSVGNRSEKPLVGKNYSIWTYAVTLEVDGKSAEINLQSFTKSPRELNVGDVVEFEKKVNGQYVNYVLEKEVKPAGSFQKSSGFKKYPFDDFKKLALECWMLTSNLALGLPEELVPEGRLKMFDKLLGTASVLVDLSTLEKNNVQKVNEVFNNEEESKDVPF